MKNSFLAPLFLIGMVLVPYLQAQPARGMMELALNGPVLQSYSESDLTILAPTATWDYFATNALEVGAILGLSSYTHHGSQTGVRIGVNVRYHTSPSEKLWPFVGGELTSLRGDLYKQGDNSPLLVQGEIGFKYWPMPGGAIMVSGFYANQSPGQPSYGINLGLLIRVR